MMEAKIVSLLFILAVHGRWDEFSNFLAFAKMLFDNTTKLSPEDQAKMNQVFDRATASIAKADAALPQN